jgi:mono/diheme cytochrome c family protein/ABC-type amino acid transport substrate-binding protein
MLRVALLITALVLGALPAAAGSPDVLRVCADPDNLPFSSAAATGDRGLYVELAERLAARMGKRTELVWWLSYHGKRTVRSTLLADRCDVYFGLPADPGFMPAVSMTRPFLEVGYALIVPPAWGVSRLEDLQRGKVAVEFASPPSVLLASRGGFDVVTFRRVEEALEALGRREVDAAFVWGPSAGYFNRSRLGGAYQVIPVAGAWLQGRASVGVRKGRDELKAAVERELLALAPEIAGLADRYGFPRGTPITLGPGADLLPEPGGPRGGAPTSGAPAAAAGPPPASPGAAAAAPAPAPASSPAGAASAASLPGSSSANGASVIPSGRKQFNVHCSHCHSPNAHSPEPSRDLRRLRIRYGEAMKQTFYATVTNGRPEKGMPPWKEILNEETIWLIFAFLESVQREP